MLSPDHIYQPSPQVNIYGTGSYPPSKNGLQRKNRFNAKNAPFAAPYFVIASTAYAEQVGRYLHRAGKYGDIAPW
jgi:hypothetical protein